MNRFYILSAVAVMVMALLASCSSQSWLDVALEKAGKNRRELEAVLDHYRGDSLKYAAAAYLIGEMPYRYGLEGEEVERLHSFYKAASRSAKSPQAVTDSMRTEGAGFSRERLRLVPDITNVSAAFLIEHIDMAFEIRQKQPWGRKIDFDTFCRHILPYRVGNEQLRPWLRELYEQFDHLLDSIRATSDSADIVKVTEALVGGLQKMRRNYGHGLPSGVTIGPDNTRWFAGDCREFTDIQTYIMRAVGLPGGCDKMPMYGNYFLPHFWNYVIDEKGATHYCSVLFKTPLTEPAAAYPGPKGKVMREKFELDRLYARRLGDYADVEGIHPEFRYFTNEDVTPLYSGDSIKTVIIPLDSCYEKPRNEEFIYACLSTHMDWAPVDVALWKGNNIEIKDVDGDVVMRLGVYRDGKLRFISNPFNICKKDGSVRFYNPTDIKEDVCLLYKFDDIFRERFSIGMVGGVMEGSDYPDFREKDTLHMIVKAPARLYTRAKSKSDRAYKYVRYYGPTGGKCYASEVSFYGHSPGEKKNNLLKGACIGTPNLYSENKYPYTNVVDGDPYTSFVYEKVTGGWVGLALEKPMVVDSVVYTPRNRRNFIEAGDSYELFYCDKEWRSLGRKTAESDSILFEAPRGALLYLKNHTRGNQERIFEYTRDGRQIFW